MLFNQYQITSNQKKPARHLHEIIVKHSQKVYLRPIPSFVRQEFERVQRIVVAKNLPIILDSCCGTGQSSRQLSKVYPHHLVVGLDRSACRLKQDSPLPENVVLIRTICEDMWRLISAANWPIDKHYLLYPNPYPKLGDLKKRWHGHPVFPTLLSLASTLEVRSDWPIYLEEMAEGARILGCLKAEVEALDVQVPLTAFEKKYFDAGRATFRLIISPATVSDIGPA